MNSAETLLTPSLRATRALLPVALAAFVSACAATGAGFTEKAADDASPSTLQPKSAGEAPAARRQMVATRSVFGASEPEPPESLPEVSLSPQLLFQLLASEIAAQRGQLGSAAATYQRMAEDTRDPRLARRATELALAQRALDRALPAARLWYELSPQSAQAGATFETLLLSTGKLTEAEPLMAKRLARARADRKLPEYYRQTERSLARVTDKAAALKLLERLAANDLELTEARLALAAVASAAGDGERAVAEATAATRLDPDNELTAITAARFANDGPDGQAPGLAILDGFLKRKPKAIEARFAYARLLAKEGRKSDAKDQFELALKQEPESPAILFSLGQLAYQTDQKELAIDYLDRYVALPDTVQRDNNPAYLFLGQISEELKRYKDSIAYYEKVGQGQQYLDARIRRAIAMGHDGQVEEGREVLRTTSVGSARERARLTSAEAEILRVAEMDQEAFELLSAAVEKQPENPDLLYDHAMASERVDKIDIMEKSLRKVIELNPESAHAYNALGYTLADRNLRLDEARELIEKSLKLAPDDPHILDSMGWVLYRQGDLEGAEKYLRKAFAVAPEAEVSAHLGEVLHVAGKREEARKFWAKAQELDPDNKILKSTLARLNISL